MWNTIQKSEHKAENQTEEANIYREMAKDELKHADYIHQIAVDKIAKLRKVYTPSEDMLNRWEKAHIEYIEKADMAKKLLSL